MVDERNPKELKPRKVLILHNEYQQLGGEDCVVENEYQLLKKNNWPVEKLIIKSNGYNFLKKIKTAVTLADAKDEIQKIIGQIKKTQPDIVHVHNYFPLITAGVFAEIKKLSIPTVHTLHNFRMFCSNGLLLRQKKPCEICLDHSSVNGVIHHCYRDSFLASSAAALAIHTHKKRETWTHDVDQYIALSHFSESRFKKFGIQPQKMSVKPNFIFDPEVINGAPSKSKTVLYIGRLSEEKGIEILLNAWRRISNKDWKLCIIGDGPLRSLVEEYKNKNETFEYRGHQTSTHVLNALKNAAFLAFPSQCYENFPMVLLEALSVGVPILGSDLGGTKEILKPEFSALFNPQDSLDLSLKMTAWMKNNAQLDALGKEARQHYLENYTPDANFQKLAQIYEKTIQSGSYLE